MTLDTLDTLHTLRHIEACVDHAVATLQAAQPRQLGGPHHHGARTHANNPL